MKYYKNMIIVILQVAGEKVSLKYKKTRALINWKFRFPNNVRSIVVTKRY